MPKKKKSGQAKLNELELTREQIENLSEEDLRQMAKVFSDHIEAQQYAKGDLYLETAHSGQTDFHKAKNRVRMFFGGNRCLAEGTLIATPAGPKAIEDIEIGDLVYDENGKEIPVKDVFYNGVKEVADVTNRGRTLATCTGDHIWLTSTWRSDPREKASSELRRDDGIERRTFRSGLGPVREPHAYALGALLGDGCARQRGGGLQISSPDNRVPEKLSEIFGVPYKKLHEKNYTYKIMTEYCAHYDQWIRGRYSHEKIVDMDTIRLWDRQSLVEFVAGVFDTDGSLFEVEDKVVFSISMQAKPVIDAVHYACLALWQLDLKIHVDNRDKYKNGPVYDLYIQNIQRSKEMLKELDPHIVSPQKKWKEEYEYYFGKRTRENAVGASWGKNPRLRKTYDIHVESETNLYCLANGLVTHNSGKSTAGTNEARWLAEGSHPFRKFRTPTKGCIVLQDFQTHAQDVILPKIDEWFPPNLIRDKKTNQSGIPVKLICRNGSVIDIKSHDQDIKVFEGSDYDWVWFDEPPPKAIFNALWRGLTDRRGIAYITGTPIVEPWLFDLYKKAAQKDNRGTYWAQFIDIEENAANLGEGNAEEGRRRIAEFLDTLDPEEKEARKSGKFLHMSGVIFKDFDRGVHLCNPFKWPSQWPILLSVDPHPRKPWAYSFLGLTPSGTKILLTSGKIDGVVGDVAAELIYARNDIELEGGGVPYIQDCWIDNYANVESMIVGGGDGKGVRIIDELNHAVRPTLPGFRPAPKNVEDKIQIFKDWLKPRETKFGTRPAFLAFDIPDNQEFIYEMEHYVWAKQRGVNRNKYKNVPVKENDDILDTIMQLCLVLGSKKGNDLRQEPPKKSNYLQRRLA